MSHVPNDLKYTSSHEWIRVEDNGLLTVGITEHAQAALGDLVFVELPETGTELQSGDECCVVESVKAASDIYCPLNAEIAEVNDALSDTPELVNQDPYGEGWLFRIQIENEEMLNELLDSEGYQDLISEE